MPKKTHVEWGSRKLRGRIWWVRYYDQNGKKVEESTRSQSEEDARNLLDKRYVEVRGGTFQGALSKETTVGDLLDGVITNYEVNGNRADCQKSRVEHIRAALGNLTLAQFDARSQALCYKMMTDLLKAGYSKATANMCRDVLRRAFTVGKETLGLVDRIPAFPPSLEDKDSVRQGFFEEEQYQTIRAELSEWKQPILDAGYYSLARKDEIESFRWEHVDLLAREIKLPPGTTKNKSGRTIPMTDEMYAVIQMQKTRRDAICPQSPWVFFSADGGQERIYWQQWTRVCLKLGWVRPNSTPVEQNKSYQRTKDKVYLWEPTVHFHDLRRTGIRNLTRAGVPEKIVMRWSGHKSNSVFKRYDITNDADLHWAADRSSAARRERLAAAEKAAEAGRAEGAPAPAQAQQRVN